jgi:hypothetical protein
MHRAHFKKGPVPYTKKKFQMVGNEFLTGVHFPVPISPNILQNTKKLFRVSKMIPIIAVQGVTWKGQILKNLN